MLDFINFFDWLLSHYLLSVSLLTLEFIVVQVLVHCVVMSRRSIDPNTRKRSGCLFCFRLCNDTVWIRRITEAGLSNRSATIVGVLNQEEIANNRFRQLPTIRLDTCAVSSERGS